MIAFLWRNPRLFTDPRRVRDVVTAMRAHAIANPVCQWCGGGRVEVHHIQPVHVAPQLAMRPDNMISLCRRCHLVVGHLGSFKRYCSNVRDVCLARREDVR
jgi:5-methylcytosine-specific restriction endonuclease McrA